MDDIQLWTERITKLRDSLNDILTAILKDSQTFILDLNTTGQLYQKGILNTGQEVVPPYKPFTMRIKQSKGQPADRVTLRDTGDFHSSFFIVFEKDRIEIKADDWKAASLQIRYSEEIYGLTEANIDALKNYIKEKYADGLRKYYLSLS